MQLEGKTQPALSCCLGGCERYRGFALGLRGPELVLTVRRTGVDADLRALRAVPRAPWRAVTARPRALGTAPDGPLRAPKGPFDPPLLLSHGPSKGASAQLRGPFLQKKALDAASAAPSAEAARHRVCWFQRRTFGCRALSYHRVRDALEPAPGGAQVDHLPPKPACT